MLHPLISIIIPIYNVEPYLRQCLDCIINQTYTNLEIILVDDGSPDNCPQICDEYAAKDNRIKVIHKKNGGLSDARNAGLDICKGDYITFVDSDDLLDINAIKSMLDANNDSSIILANINVFIGDDKSYKKKFTVCNNINYTEQSSDELLLNLCKEGPVYLRSVCGKLIRKVLFHNIRFPKGKLYEDMFINYQLYYNSCKNTFIPNALYYYRGKRPGSIMSKTISSTFAIEAEEKRYAFLKEHGKQSIAKYNLPSLCWNHLFLYSQNRPDSKSKFLYFTKEYFKYFTKLDKTYICLKLFSLCPQIYYLFKKISPWQIRRQ